MGQLSLPESSLVYVDTVVVIYSIEKFPDYFSLLEPLWQKLQAGKVRVITSEITLLEALVMPIRRSDTGMIRQYERLLLSSEISLIPVTQAILRGAANLRAQTNLKTPDAIHAATALNMGCTLFLTNDSGLRKTPELPVTVLKDVLER
jgi:predicted nucleic acid-binding protein